MVNPYINVAKVYVEHSTGKRYGDLIPQEGARNEMYGRLPFPPLTGSTQTVNARDPFMSSRGSVLSQAPDVKPQLRPSSAKPDLSSLNNDRVDDNVEEFKGSLRIYGRSIISSALEHAPVESQSLEKDIIATKDKVIAQYRNVASGLVVAEQKNRQLGQRNATLSQEIAEVKRQFEIQTKTTEQIEKQSQAQLSDRLNLLNTLEAEEQKVKELGVELARYRNDKKRKREEVVEVWERAEKIKLDR